MPNITPTLQELAFAREFLGSYFSKLLTLSDITAPDMFLHFPCNEPDQANVPGLASCSGSYAGVGLEQNFTYIAAMGFDERKDDAVIVDKNLAMTEGLLPYVCMLVATYEYRIDFLSVLLRKRIELADVGWSQSQELEPILLRLLSGRDKSLETSHALGRVLEEFIPPGHDAGKYLCWKLDELEGEGIDSWTRINLSCQDKVGSGGFRGWLADEATYRRVHNTVRSGCITAVSADWFKPGSVGKLGRMLDDRGQSIGVAYMSNLHNWGVNPDKYERNIRALPLKNDALFIWSGPVSTTHSGTVDDYIRWITEPHQFF